MQSSPTWPGALACRVAPGVLEKYEHLDRLRTHEGESGAGGGGGTPNAAGEPGAAAGGVLPCGIVDLNLSHM